MQHLLAFSALANDRRIPADTRFVLLFVQGFGRYVAAGEPTEFPSGFSTRLARFAFRRMAGQVRKGRVILAGETAGMVDELKRFTGLPATLFPHPVHLPAPPANTDATRPDSDDGILTVSCPGYARHEKGSDLLHDAILRILDGPDGHRFHFVLQWPAPIGMPGGGTMSPDPRLLADGRVEFLNDNLPSVQYAALLERSHFIILPYRSHSYHQRLSRVAIEAAGMGIPLIYTKHTWVEEVVGIVGAGVPIKHETVDSVVEALRMAAGHASELRRSARENSRKIKEFHSAAEFRRRLQFS
jgi:glycosyltransferase involved in cell wall biosynthesis